jgi:hypothetical protein
LLILWSFLNPGLNLGSDHRKFEFTQTASGKLHRRETRREIMDGEQIQDGSGSKTSPSLPVNAVVTRLLRPTSGQSFDDSLVEMNATASSDEAAEDRRFRRLATQVDREASTLIGILITLAERRARCLVTMQSGWEWSGVTTGVGRDFAVLLADDGRRAVLRLRAVSSVQTVGAEEATGENEPPIDNTFEALLSEFAGYDDEVTIVLDRPKAAESQLTGKSAWQGSDIACVRGAHGLGSYAYVPIASIIGLVTS